MHVERLAWRKSSFSGDGEDGNGCVEVAPVATGVAVRDTKDRTLTPHVYSGPAWHALLAAVRAGEL
ncbi:DUF397 domain-containing protein [Pseudonocardia sp. CA-107938]|uniref:DUF397 domain-containing protein n=1 Tax=Pseudonocardia sp. CA-107938 TaxID=3240021 RepID=UPI003D939C76